MVDVGLRIFVYGCCLVLALWALYVLAAVVVAGWRGLRRLRHASPWRPLP